MRGRPVGLRACARLVALVSVLVLVRLRVRDGKPAGYEDFIIGWQGADGKRWGRPVDVVVAKDGAVLVSDDAAGLILRVAAR